MTSKKSLASRSKKSVRDNQDECYNLIAKTPRNVDWEMKVTYDHVSTDVWMDRKNVTIEKVCGKIPQKGYWLLRAKLTKTTEPGSFEVAVGLGFYYFVEPSVFAAFSFTAQNDDGLDFFTGGTFLFTAENSMNYRVCEDKLPGNPSEVCLTPYFLFPESVLINESISLKLRVKIFPREILDERYKARIRMCQFRAPRSKFGFHSSLPNAIMNDFSIRVGNVEIPCHRNILSCRSQYFAEMFLLHGGQTVSAQEYEYFEEYVHPDVQRLKMMVDFIYTSDIPELTIDSAEKLLQIAHRFEVHDLTRICIEFLNKEMYRLSKVKHLKNLDDKIMQKLEIVANDIKTREAFTVQSAMMILNLTKTFPVDSAKLHCENYLMGEINESNVLEILVKADYCRSSKLKRKAIDFVQKNFMELTMDQYDVLIKERPQLFKDILMAIATNW